VVLVTGEKIKDKGLVGQLLLACCCYAGRVDVPALHKDRCGRKSGSFSNLAKTSCLWRVQSTARIGFAYASWRNTSWLHLPTT
jgi:hypothetical protein